MARSVLLTLLGAIALAVPAAGQPPVRDIVNVDGVFAEPFTRLTGLRELSDGRVVIADATERHVSVLDFATGAMHQVGRTGEGPGEYQTPGGLLMLPDDGTLLIDFGNVRLTQITSAGRLTESWPMLTGDGRFRRPTGADRVGNVYFAATGSFSLARGSNIEFPDSAPVVRWDLAHDATETVASVFTEPAMSGGPVRLSGGNGGAMRISGMRMRQTCRPARCISQAPGRARYRHFGLAIAPTLFSFTSKSTAH